MIAPSEAMVLDQLHEALARGWSVIPVQADKRPFFTWRPYQTERPSLEQVQHWTAEYGPSAWAVVTGSLSGVVVFDFDGSSGY